MDQGRSDNVKILTVTGIFPPDIGGPATYVPKMAAALAERGHDLAMLTLSDSLDHPNDAYPFQVVRILRAQLKPWRWLRTVVKIIQMGSRADVLFVHGLAMEAALANLMLRKPLVLKVVGDLAWERAMNSGAVKDSFEDFQEKRYSVKVEVLKALRTWWTLRSDKVIVPSRYLGHSVAGWGVPEEKIVVVYNALEQFDVIAPADVPVRSSIRIVTVGRLVPWKRVDQILEAIARLDEIGLVIVGDGPEGPRLKELAQALGVADRTYFAGQRSKSETLALMSACDIFVLNSTYEGLPHVVLEAMSLGLPVVATAVGGTPEVVRHGENGLAIQPGDADSLYEALRELASSPENRHKFVANALKTAKSFSYSRMVEETQRVLLSGKGTVIHA